jgi:two-component system cell cycle sensor histidine kinase/response regulator CckA
MAEPSPAEASPCETILVADDEPMVLNLAGTILRRGGYKVLAAPDGAAALELFRGHPVDLVLTDVIMPAMTGHQLVHQIRAEKSDIPCIFMSGYTPQQIREKGGDDPGCNYLSKPFTPERLLNMVRQELAA